MSPLVVDVLTEIERAARAMDSLGLLDYAKRLRDCHSAVADLAEHSRSAVEYVAKSADAVDVNRRMAGRPDSLNVARVIETNLRDALAHVGGAA